MDALELSVCIFDLILEDIRATYPFVGGGGLSSIVQNSTTTFTASILQEERSDLLIYEISIAEDGSVSISDKKVSAETQK